MSLLPTHQQTLQEIRALFIEAECAIKDVEDTGGELVVPAVNQLRYTGNHLIRYLADPDGEMAVVELADCVKHCKRATYDAYEAAILNQLMEFQKFKDDYRNTQITAIIPCYHEIAGQIEKARAFARNNNQSKTGANFIRPGGSTCRLLLRVSASSTPAATNSTSKSAVTGGILFSRSLPPWALFWSGLASFSISSIYCPRDKQGDGGSAFQLAYFAIHPISPRCRWPRYRWAG